MLGEQNTQTRRDAGFTLIELLVVVVIIGILAAIAIPVYLTAKNTATDSAVKADVTQLKKAVIGHMVTNDGSFVAVASLKSDGYSGPSVGYASADQPSYATGVGPTVVLPTNGSGHFCVAATSPTGAQWFATDTRVASKVGGTLALCG